MCGIIKIYQNFRFEIYYNVCYLCLFFLDSDLTFNAFMLLMIKI